MKKPTDITLAISADYRQFIEELKARVVSARILAARAITHEAILLYWDIGQGIVEKQKEHGWGDSVVKSSPRICSGPLREPKASHRKIFGGCSSSISFIINRNFSHRW